MKCLLMARFACPFCTYVMMEVKHAVITCLNEECTHDTKYRMPFVELVPVDPKEVQNEPDPPRHKLLPDDLKSSPYRVD